jgi:uncharacterized protein YijF (DUF1287 family)
MERRSFITSGLATLLAAPAVPSRGEKLAEAALHQVGETPGYDPRYVRIAYPGGDVPRSTGVCADVVVRAGRDALKMDLQQLVHEDMLRSFSAYPRTWGMKAPDANIDHRRVPNLETFWRRMGAELWATPGHTSGDDFGGAMLPGDRT